MESIAEHFSAFLFLWFFQGIARAEEQNICHKTHFFLSLTQKNLCSFRARTVKCVLYYVYLLFFNNTMQKIFLKIKHQNCTISLV